ncbi:MAG: chromate transporter [Clostridia bacterium]|nr:chromate transporter [Clostridia bacterium]
MIYLRLFYEFFKIGLFAIGGGPATLPFLMELAKTSGWYDTKTLTAMIAVSEGTPGPLGINMATYVGFHVGGVWGGITATVALVLPGLVIIILVAKFLALFGKNSMVTAAFYAIRPAVTGLILSAVIGIWQIGVVSAGTLALAAGALALMFFTPLRKLHPLIWLVFGALAGLVFNL